MTKIFFLFAIGVWLFGFCPPAMLSAEVTAEPNDRGVVIKIDGKLFAEYLRKAGNGPAIWPLIGPTGKPVTRSYPFKAPPADGTKDHPHHHSFWFTHDEVNGAHLWRDNLFDQKVPTAIVARKLVVSNSTGPMTRIVTQNDWTNDNKRLCQDETIYTFGTLGNARWIDANIKITASDGDVTFGDTKEGSFALRVADSMRVDAKKGGHIVSSEGLEDAAAWGMPARWVDYTGPVDGEIVGITLMSHPKSFRPTPRWHVRTYGLFAANPFGQKEFPHHDAAKQGAVTIKNGESLSLHYCVLLHRGKTNVDEIEAAFREFASR